MGKKSFEITDPSSWLTAQFMLPYSDLYGSKSFLYKHNLHISLHMNLAQA